MQKKKGGRMLQWMSWLYDERVSHERQLCKKEQQEGAPVKYTPSREDYLISIYLLREKRGMVRSIDVVQMLGYSKPSVCNGIHLLQKHQLVSMDEQKFLYLTPEGERQAVQIYERYQTVLRFLQEVLRVSERTAYQDACKIEHIISTETLEKMRKKLSIHP